MSVQAQIINLLQELKDRLHLSMIIVSYDLMLVYRLADRVIVLYTGRVVEEGSVEQVIRYPAHPFTVNLIESVPGLPRTRRFSLSAKFAEPPSSIALSRGCAFASRCQVARSRCNEERPDLRDIGGSAVACHYPIEADSVSSG